MRQFVSPDRCSAVAQPQYPSPPMIMTRVPPPLLFAVPAAGGASVVAVAATRSVRRLAGAAAITARAAGLPAALRAALMPAEPASGVSRNQWRRRVCWRRGGGASKGSPSLSSAACCRDATKPQARRLAQLDQAQAVSYLPSQASRPRPAVRRSCRPSHLHQQCGLHQRFSPHSWRHGRPNSPVQAIVLAIACLCCCCCSWGEN
jgi:hypothetical protein